jgi:ATP-binding cassette subfamily B protein
MSLYRRVISYYKPYTPTICGALFLLLINIALNLLKPWPIKWLIDVVVPQSSSGKILWQGHEFNLNQSILLGCSALIFITLLSGIFSLSNNYLLIKTGLRALLRLRTELYSYLQHLPLHFHDRRRSGDSTFRVAYDSQAIQTFFNRGFATILGSLITLIGTFAIMLKMDASLAFLSFSVIPFLWGTIYFFSHRVRRQTMILQQEESDVLARASEGLSSIRIVHAFGREEYEVKEFEREAEGSLSANLQLTTTNILSTLAVSTIMAVGTAAILFLGTKHVIDGHLKIGDLWVFLSYLTMLYQPLEQLSYTACSL